jgi:WD40 repeat protein
MGEPLRCMLAMDVSTSGTPRPVATCRPSGTVPGARAFIFSPGGQSIGVCYHDHQVKIWDTATGRLQLVLKGHTDDVASVAFSPDGRQLVSSGHDQTIRLWDLASGQALLTLKGHSGWVPSVAFSGDGRHIASASDDGMIIVWDASP